MHIRDKQDGYTLFIIASLMVVFLGFTALSVDLGVLYSARASAQRAADAAALAGAFVFVTRGDLDETTTPKQSDVIKQHAIATAATNKVLGKSVTISTGDVIVDVDKRLVTVNVAQSQGTLFARILGESSANIQATAVAEAATAANATGCLKPFFIPNGALSTDEPCVTCWGADSTPATGDDPITKHLLIEKVGTEFQVTSWAKQQIRDSTALNKLNQFVLKPKSPHNALRPGDFFLIDIQGEAIDAKVAESISTCLIGANCGSAYSILTGAKVGPVRSGVKDMIGCPSLPDTYVAAGQYRHADNTISSTSRSLVACPVWDVCNEAFGSPAQPFCPSAEVPGGTSPMVHIVGFALVFVEGVANGSGEINCNGGQDVIARIISVAACGSTGGGTINPGETGPYGVPIRLVRAP
jgi:Flp pilus assembly protein TadG